MILDESLFEEVRSENRLIWDDCTPTRERRETTIDDIEEDIHVVDYTSKNKLLADLIELAGVEEEDFEDGDTFDEKVNYCLNSLSDPGDGSPNILYINIENDDNYDYFTYDELQDLDLANCSEQEVKDALTGNLDDEYSDDEDEEDNDEEDTDDGNNATIHFNSNLNEEVQKGEVRGPYRKKNNTKLSYNKIYDRLEDLGYRVRTSDKLDDSIMVSKKKEKNLKRAIDYCNEVGLTYDQRFSPIQQRYYLDIHLPADLKEDLILDPTEEDKKLLNDLLDKYKDTKYEKILDQLKAKYEFEDTFGGKEEELKEELFTVELYKVSGEEPERERFDSYEKAMEFAKGKTENGYEEIIINSHTINGPSNENRWHEGKWFKEDLKEDLSQEEQQEYGLNTLINSLIKDEYDAIDSYNSAIVTLEAENQGEYTDVIRSIIEDERHHIGNLQEIMNRITPGTEQEFEKGKEEAIDTLEEEPKEDVETIKDVELEDSALQA